MTGLYSLHPVSQTNPHEKCLTLRLDCCIIVLFGGWSEGGGLTLYRTVTIIQPADISWITLMQSAVNKKSITKRSCFPHQGVGGVPILHIMYWLLSDNDDVEHQHY